MKFIRYRRWRPYWLVLGLLILLLSNAGAEERFFPVEKLKPGMTGSGYSVFLGTKIERFDVRILSVVDRSSGQGKWILVRLTGRPLVKSGGLAAGMSGSPVYIDRKLVGAISYGFENADAFLALVTPIINMLQLEPQPEAEQISIDGLGKPLPLMTPVLISGLGSRGFDLLSHSLAAQGLQAINLPDLGAPSSQQPEDPLQPGSAIAVQMVSGDFQVSAIGTVTLIDHNKFLAFGHSFTNKGSVDFAAYQAYIFHTVKSPVQSFKFGASLQPIGRVVQDRRAGVLGRLGEAPNLLPVIVRVNDLDRNLTHESRFQVTNNEQLYRELIVSGATDAIDQTIDRLGSGTAKVGIVIDTTTQEKAVIWENLFYGKDIAVSCLKDLRSLLDLLSGNDFTALDLKQIRITIAIQSDQRTARLIKLEAEKTRVKPGETFKINLLLHSYRGKDFTIPLEVKLPNNLDSGKLLLTASGGAKGSNGEDETNHKKDAPVIDYQGANSLPELIAAYLSKKQNNQVVVEYFTTASDAKSELGAAPEKPKPVEVRAATDYYILGETSLTIEVIQP